MTFQNSGLKRSEDIGPERPEVLDENRGFPKFSLAKKAA